MKKEYAARAFVSCSLRHEDENFVNLVCQILKEFNIEPFGTVGKFSASPENPVELMRKNIPESDIVVICATPRYIQKDIKTGNISYGLSEMVHVETGMAIALGKPVVVFVQEGTNVGNAIPNITQYIELHKEGLDVGLKVDLISSLLDSAHRFVETAKRKKGLKTAGNVLVGGLAIVGGIALLSALFSDKGNNKV